MSERILDYIKPINEDTNELAGDTSATPTSHRILDYVKDIQNDTDTIVESGGGGGGGGESAGFGTPTATATQLESDQQPTVDVEASGPNTAKVFSFSFGIPKGEKGDTGETGPQGEAGPQGEKGDTGATGPQGDPGAQGPKGDTGAAAGFGTPTATATQLEPTDQPTVQVSASGDDTEKVFSFRFGIPKGEKGDTGAQGERGEQGEKGDKGNPGEDGASAGFGTPTASATQLEAGVPPTVSVQASGEDTAKVFAFSFGIPKGEKGDTGVQGEPGAKGDAGADGSPAGFGTPTASATQLESTQQPTVQVTASGENTAKVFKFVFGIPKGEKGDKGDTGAQGATGETGPAGADGADGVTPAITATAEVDSTTGTPAVQVTKSGTETAPSFKFSFTGLKGETGAKGEKGDKGDTGPQGPQGEIGPQGPAGTVTVSQPDYYGTDVSTTGVATYTIPNYASTNIVEVYLNGFRLELTTEYTISSEGVVTTVNSVNSGGRLLVVVWRF